MHGFDSKSRTLTHFIAFEEHMAVKCLAKSSRSLLPTALYSNVYTRRINYDSATVDNSVFIEQRKKNNRMIFHYKIMRLGDLS